MLGLASYSNARSIATRLISPSRLFLDCRHASSVSASNLKPHQLRQDRSSIIRPGKPDGQAIAFSTAEKYDIDALRKQLWNKSLLGRGDGRDAMNLMGEAIWIPQWPLPTASDSAGDSGLTSHVEAKSIEDSGPEQAGEIFIFESGSYVAWHMNEEHARQFAEQVLSSRASAIAGGSSNRIEVDKYRELQTEAMDFMIRPGEKTGVRDDLIYIGSSSLSNGHEIAHARQQQPQQDVTTTSSLPEAASVTGSRGAPLATAIEPVQPSTSKAPIEFAHSSSPIPVSQNSSGHSSHAQRVRLPRSEDDLRARLSLSIGLARSTKLAVYEEMLDDYMDQFSSLPSQLVAGLDSPLKKRDIIQRTGALLLIRQYLNLNSSGQNLMDAPEMFWNQPVLELWFKELTRALEIKTRLENLNRKLDYSLQLQATLQELESTKVSHRLEWIIIILIAIEIGLALWREGIPGFSQSHSRSRTVEPIPQDRELMAPITAAQGKSV